MPDLNKKLTLKNKKKLNFLLFYSLNRFFAVTLHPVKRQTLIFIILCAVIATMATGYSTPRRDKRGSAGRDTALLKRDSAVRDTFAVAEIPLDSLGADAADTAAAAIEYSGPDTTKMDSLCLDSSQPTSTCCVSLGYCTPSPPT